MRFARHTHTDDHESLMVILDDGSTAVFGSAHPCFRQVLDLVTSGEDVTDEQVLELQDATASVTSSLRRLSERVSLRDGNIILFDGTPIDKTLTGHIVAMCRQGDPQWAHLVAFMENLATNPSEKSRRHLYHFIDSHGLTITRDGMFVAYKGVDVDGCSVHSGPGIVDGVPMHGHLPNEVGSVLEMDRSAVDDDRHIACSRGLHVGTFDYASHFAPRLLTVVVNPRDVVSVPQDCSDAKVRVCRYKVQELAPALAYMSATITFGDGWVDDDWDDDWDGE